MIEKFAMTAVEMDEYRTTLFEAMVESGMSYQEIAEKMTLVIQHVCEEADITISAERAAHAAELFALNKKACFGIIIITIVGLIGIKMVYERGMYILNQ
jgi:hypothetical protein